MNLSLRANDKRDAPPTEKLLRGLISIHLPAVPVSDGQADWAGLDG